MHSAECFEFGKKNSPVTLEGISTGGRTCSDCLLLLQGLISGGALKYEYYYSSSNTVGQRCSTSNIYVLSFIFAGRIETEGCSKVELIRPSVTTSIRKTDQSHHTWLYMLGQLSTAARSNLWRRTEIRVLLQQQQQYNSSSEVFYFEYV